MEVAEEAAKEQGSGPFAGLVLKATQHRRACLQQLVTSVYLSRLHNTERKDAKVVVHEGEE